MAKFRKKPVVIEATQWFQLGDHPDVVQFYDPSQPTTADCKHCGRPMKEHGWLLTLEGGHIVCPADQIITGVAGEMYPCKPAIFKQTYDPVIEHRAN